MYLLFCAPFKKTTHCTSSHRSKSTKYLWRPMMAHTSLTDRVWWTHAALHSSRPYSEYTSVKGGGGFSTSLAIFSRPFFVMPVKSATLALISCESGTVSMWHRNSWFPAPRPLPHLLRGRSAVSDGWQSGGSTTKQEKILFLPHPVFLFRRP